MKRKSLLVTLPWLTLESLDDKGIIPQKFNPFGKKSPSIESIDTHMNMSQLNIDQMNTISSDETQDSILLQSNILSQKPSNLENQVIGPKYVVHISPINSFSELDATHQNNVSTLFQGESALYSSQHVSHDAILLDSNSTSIFSPKIPLQIHDLIAEIERMGILNSKLTIDNNLYDLELNKALEANMSLEVELDELTRKLVDPVSQTKVKNPIEPFNEYKEKNRQLVIQIQEYRKREEG